MVRKAFYNCLVLVSLELLAVLPGSAATDAPNVSSGPEINQRQPREDAAAHSRRSTRRMLLERKFLITQKQKLRELAKTNPVALKYIRIINMQLIYIEKELQQRRDFRRPKA